MEALRVRVERYHGDRTPQLVRIGPPRRVRSRRHSRTNKTPNHTDLPTRRCAHPTRTSPPNHQEMARLGFDHATDAAQLDVSKEQLRRILQGEPTMPLEQMHRLAKPLPYKSDTALAAPNNQNSAGLRIGSFTFGFALNPCFERKHSRSPRTPSPRQDVCPAKPVR